MTRGEIAKNYFEEGYTCSQAVALAFSDIVDIPSESLSAIAAPFGGGMGRMREVCGAVSGSFIILGLTQKYTDPKDSEGKMALYANVRELADRFKKENGTIICRELLEGIEVKKGIAPEERSSEYYKKRPCGELVKCAADNLEAFLTELSIL